MTGTLIEPISVPAAHTATGLLFAYRQDMAVNPIPRRHENTWKRAIRDFTREELSPLFPFDFKMPCGFLGKYQSLDEVPLEDVPCPCGNPQHWFVRYRYQDYD